MSAKDYDHKAIESKWQQDWADRRLYETKDSVEGKENFYALFEFPYPSGNLHVGHWYAYAPTDVIARYQRMNGKNILFPIGFDSFGLPAENAAIKRGLDPRDWTYKNIDTMTDQIKSIGTSVDWSREVKTSDPEYYKWTQYIFTQFLEKGLAYEAEAEVNYCPTCKTVVANEQVVDGNCERCDSAIEKRTQKQWTLRITDYAEELLNDLDSLDWPEEIKAAQRAWIGKSQGVNFTFEVKLTDDQQPTTYQKEVPVPSVVEVFTTRPDTLYGATYLVVSPEHNLVDKYLEVGLPNADKVLEYVKVAQSKTDVQRQEAKEKTGVKLEGVSAIHPATGEELPIYVADYVLGSYGTGAIMAVPAHDERDFEFAQNYDLPIKQVVAPYTVMKEQSTPRSEQNIFEFEASTVIIQHWDEKSDKFYVVNFENGEKGLVGGSVEAGESREEAAIREVIEESGFNDIKSTHLLIENAFSRGFKERKNREELCSESLYLVRLNSESRQNIVDKETKNGEWVKGSEIYNSKILTTHHQSYFEKYFDFSYKTFTAEGLLVNSENFDSLTSAEAGEKITEEFGESATTYRLRDWSVGRQRYWGCPIPVVYDPQGQAHPIPEQHLPWLLPNDVDHTPDGTAPLARSGELKARTEEIFGNGWKPAIDTMDTFVDSSWYYVRYTDPQNGRQLATADQQQGWLPVDFYSGGAEHTTMHLLYSRFFYKAMRDCGLLSKAAGDEPFKKRSNRSIILGPDGNKMSKSKGNVIDPDQQVANVGADAVRTYLCFMGPYNEVSHYPWDPNGLVGVRKFLERVNGLSEYMTKNSPNAVEVALQKAIKGVTESIDQKKLNTAVSSLMIFSNEVEKQKQITKVQLQTMTQLLAPFAPHLAEELWQRYGREGSIHESDWPQYNEIMLQTEEVTIPVQINGKKIGQIKVPRDAAQGLVERLAKGNSKVKLRLKGDPKKVIYVKNRILNLVIDNKD
jgi:leucyl-tRNA synthetase